MISRRSALAVAVILASSATDVSWAQTPPFDPVAKKYGGPPRLAPSPLPLQAFVAKTERLWAFDCSDPGNRDRVIRIRFVVGADGRFSDGPTVLGTEPTVPAAEDAIRVLLAGQPYSADEVPLAYRYKGITVNFHTKDVCAAK